jgi:CubicO group peptidase (beta-lactamase class C family)
MTKRYIAGSSVAVVRGGRTIFARGYGWAKIEQSAPARPNAAYQIRSTTKPFTAAAILMLVESGRFSLHDKESKYLQRLPIQNNDVTIRQLLTHTSGVNMDLRTGNTDEFTLDEFWKRLATGEIRSSRAKDGNTATLVQDY